MRRCHPVLVFTLTYIAGCEEGSEQPVYREVVNEHDVGADTRSRVRLVTYESGTKGERFLRNAASASRMQVELGRMALRQSADPRVKDFARRMIDDHRIIERDVLDAADARDIAIAPGLTPAHRTLVGQVAPLNAAEFDREYARMMVNEHITLVREYDEEVRSALDPHVRDFAKRNLPTQRDHLEKARALAPPQS
jgi:putative membrane protein